MLMLLLRQERFTSMYCMCTVCTVLCFQSILIRWTKGFACEGVEGKDVVQLLREAIKRRGVSHCAPLMFYSAVILFTLLKL